MLEDFRPTIHPFNKPIKIDDSLKDVITIGGTAVQSFKLDFNYLTYVKTDVEYPESDTDIVDNSHAKVIYRQGFDVVLEKYPKDFTIDAARRKSYLTVVLSPEETSLFKPNYLDVSVQIMVENKEGHILYDVPSKLKVVIPNDYTVNTNIDSMEGIDLL